MASIVVISTIVFKSFQVCGPFLLRKELRELSPGKPIPSLLSPSGLARWYSVEIDSSRYFQTRYPGVEAVEDYLGCSGLMSYDFAYTRFNSSFTEGMAEMKGVAEFWINGRHYVGNYYGDKALRIPVQLKDGENEILLRIIGFGEKRFRFQILPARAPVEILDDYIVPDLWIQTDSILIGVALANTTDEWATGVSIDANHTSLSLPPLPPLSVYKFPLMIPLSGDTIEIKVTFHNKEERKIIILNRKSPRQHRIETFISRIDSSCQYYALLPPKDYDPSKRYGLVLALHGAGVRAERLIRCYQPKDWCFIVAPTNRRRYGYDWEDFGRIDLLEVMETVLKRYPIDSTRIYLTGHSMGGHGVWHIGSLYPDRFAAIGPLAGWVSKGLYIPDGIRVGLSNPEIMAIRLRMRWLESPLSRVENLRLLPIYIIHGGKDRCVPPLQSHILTTILRQYDIDYHYREVPDRPHWWKGCVDDDRLFKFFKDQTRTIPDSFLFITPDPEVNDRCFWIRVITKERPSDLTRIEAVRKKDRILIKTENATAICVYPEGRQWLTVDGRRFDIGESDSVLLVKEGDHFHISNRLSRSPSGPIKKAFFKPFLLVYGDDSDLEIARLLAMEWWLRGNGRVRIIKDSDIRPEDLHTKNLVLIGSKGSNLLVRKLLSPVPSADNFMIIAPSPYHPDRLLLFIKGEPMISPLLPMNELPDFVIARGVGWERCINCGFLKK